MKVNLFRCCNNIKIHIHGASASPLFQHFPEMYKNPAMNLFCSFFSSPRFFTETLSVSDAKCLPSQSGFTVSTNPDSVNFPEGKSSFDMLFWGQNDLHITDAGCNGWYWNVWPALFVGLTLRYLSFGIINSFNLEMHAKKSFWFQLRHQGSSRLYLSVGIFCAVFVVMFTISAVLVLVPR